MLWFNPITAVELALAIVGLVILSIVFDKLHYAFRGSRVIYDNNSAQRSMRVSSFVGVTLVFFAMGFFPWDGFILSERQREVIRAEADLHAATLKVQAIRERATSAPLELERLENQISILNSNFSRKRQDIQDQISDYRLQKEENYRSQILASELSLKEAEAKYESDLARISSIVALAYSEEIANLELNIAKFKENADELSENDEADKDAIAAYEAAIAEARSSKTGLVPRIESKVLSGIEDALAHAKAEHSAQTLRTRSDIDSAVATYSRGLNGELRFMANDLEQKRFEINELQAFVDSHEARSKIADATRLSLEARVNRISEEFDATKITDSEKNVSLALRAIALGALGALVTLLISYERNRTRSFSTLFSASDFYALIISHVVRGCVVAAAGYAIVFTDILSFYEPASNGNEVNSTIPDYWKMTVVCIALGAFSEKIYDAIGARIPAGDAPQVDGQAVDDMKRKRNGKGQFVKSSS